MDFNRPLEGAIRTPIGTSGGFESYWFLGNPDLLYNRIEFIKLIVNNTRIGPWSCCASPGSLGEGDFIYQIWGTPQAIPIAIDIKPGSTGNPIDPRSKDIISVAILTTDTFDATIVDPLSGEFGAQGAVEAHGRGHIEDVNKDGSLDLLLHFNTQDTGIQCGDTSASLTGQTFREQEIEGTDAITTVGCR